MKELRETDLSWSSMQKAMMLKFAFNRDHMAEMLHHDLECHRVMSVVSPQFPKAVSPPTNTQPPTHPTLSQFQTFD